MSARILIGLLGLLLSASVPAGAEDDTALDVQSWFVAYGDLWWEPGEEEIAAIREHYRLPYYLLLESGPVVMDGAALDAFLERVVSVPDWRGSRIRRVLVTLLNSTSARLEVEWQDFRSDGSAAGPCFGYEYVVGRFGDAWRIVAVTQRPCPIEEG